MSTLTTLKIECLPPTLTTHSLGSNDERSSRLCHAHMASRNGIMPPAAVYFDLFSSIARIAAFLICSGVGKSGSPGPKSAMSTPFAFNLSASAMTAAVGEIWMRLMRSVSCTSSSFGRLGKFTTNSLQACPKGANTELAGLGSPGSISETAIKLFDLGDFSAQALLDDWRHQTVERPAVLRDFANELGAQVAVGFAGQHEHRFQPRLEFAIHQRHLQFIFVIRDGTNAT